MGSRLKGRMKRLEQRTRPPSHSSHEWGKSVEEVRHEFEELPVEIVCKAAEIQERRERGEPEDSLPLSEGSKVDLAALCVSYGRPEDVPSEIREVVAERDRRAFAALPEEMVPKVEAVWKAIVDEAFELKRRIERAKAEGVK